MTLVHPASWCSIMKHHLGPDHAIPTAPTSTIPCPTEQCKEKESSFISEVRKCWRRKMIFFLLDHSREINLKKTRKTSIIAKGSQLVKLWSEEVCSPSQSSHDNCICLCVTLHIVKDFDFNTSSSHFHLRKWNVFTYSTIFKKTLYELFIRGVFNEFSSKSKNKTASLKDLITFLLPTTIYRESAPESVSSSDPYGQATKWQSPLGSSQTSWA